MSRSPFLTAACATLLGLVAGCTDIDAREEALEEAPGDQSASLSLEWSVASDAERVSCADVNAPELEVVLGSDQGTARTLSCFDGFAFLADLPTGVTSVEVSLIGPDGTPIMTVDMGERSLEANTTTALGLVEFPL